MSYKIPHKNSNTLPARFSSNNEECISRFHTFLTQSSEYISQANELAKITSIMDQANWLLRNCDDSNEIFATTLRVKHQVRSIYED